MSGCDCEMASCWRQSERRARKSHTCYECGEPILVGETYSYQSGVWDGRGSSFHMHVNCEEWRLALSTAIEARPDLGLCECFPLGHLFLALSEFTQEALGYRLDGKPTREDMRYEEDARHAAEGWP